MSACMSAPACACGHVACLHERVRGFSPLLGQTNFPQSLRPDTPCVAQSAVQVTEHAPDQIANLSFGSFIHAAISVIQASSQRSDAEGSQ